MMKNLYTVDIFPAVCAVLPPEDWDHHYSDLYCKVTQETMAIIAKSEYKRHVSTFTDAVTGRLWYDIPFAYPGPITK